METPPPPEAREWSADQKPCDYFWHGGCGPCSPEEIAAQPDYGKGDTLKHPVYKQGVKWLRVPHCNPTEPELGSGASSTYKGNTHTSWVRGFHKCNPAALILAHVLQDWKNKHIDVHMPGIMIDGFMRNGVNDGNARGVWFYLNFMFPEVPKETEIVVELVVSRSVIHSNAKTKWHLKYCATPDEDIPGAKNLYTSIAAIHFPLRMVRSDQRADAPMAPSAPWG
jgi:hypothetical protein